MASVRLNIREIKMMCPIPEESVAPKRPSDGLDMELPQDPEFLQILNLMDVYLGKSLTLGRPRKEYSLKE